MATASVSLIREQSEAVCPPRALWVPFALGRPFGSADDPEFQKQVMRAALGMLATATQPTIEDYPNEAPAHAESGQWVCPVNFPVTADESITARLIAEVTRLAPWSAETRSNRGRTLFGVTGAAPNQYEAVARALGTIADSGNTSEPPAAEGIEWKFDMPLLVRHLADDLRTFYHEAIAAQPGPSAPNHDALNDWIFGGTVSGDTDAGGTTPGGTALGDALQVIAGHLTDEGSPMSLLVRGLLIPEGYYEGGSAFPKAPEFGQEKGA